MTESVIVEIYALMSPRIFYYLHQYNGKTTTYLHLHTNPDFTNF